VLLIAKSCFRTVQTRQGQMQTIRYPGQLFVGRYQ